MKKQKWSKFPERKTNCQLPKPRNRCFLYVLSTDRYLVAWIAIHAIVCVTLWPVITLVHTFGNLRLEAKVVPRFAHEKKKTKLSYLDLVFQGYYFRQKTCAVCCVNRIRVAIFQSGILVIDFDVTITSSIFTK